MSLPSVIDYFKTGSYTIKRRVKGSVVSGIYTDGAETQFSVDASVQPITGRELKNLEEAQATMDDKVIYTRTELKCREPAFEPDIIVIGGEEYEIYRVESHQVISSHFRAFATRSVRP